MRARRSPSSRSLHRAPRPPKNSPTFEGLYQLNVPRLRRSTRGVDFNDFDAIDFSQVVSGCGELRGARCMWRIQQGTRRRASMRLASAQV